MKQKLDAERTFFDDVARAQAQGYFSEKGWDRLVEAIFRFLPVKENLRVLDLGCGTGHLLGKMWNRLPAAHLVGVDISEESIKLARSRYPAEFIASDIQTLALTGEGAEFDCVILSSVIHHFPDPSIPLRCAARHLATDGIIFSYDPNASNPFFFLYRNPASPFYSSVGLSPNERLMSQAELVGAFSSLALEVEAFGLSGVEFQWVASCFGKFVLPLFNALDRNFFENTIMEEKYGAFFVCVARYPRG